jgi:hypothetical protein
MSYIIDDEISILAASKKSKCTIVLAKNITRNIYRVFREQKIKR